MTNGDQALEFQHDEYDRGLLEIGSALSDADEVLLLNPSGCPDSSCQKALYRLSRATANGQRLVMKVALITMRQSRDTAVAHVEMLAELEAESKKEKTRWFWGTTRDLIKLAVAAAIGSFIGRAAFQG